MHYLIETHSDELYDRWLKKYSKIRTPELIIIIQESSDHIEVIYSNLGADRFKQGFKLSEVLKALILARHGYGISSKLMAFIMHWNFDKRWIPDIESCSSLIVQCFS